MNPRQSSAGPVRVAPAIGLDACNRLYRHAVRCPSRALPVQGFLMEAGSDPGPATAPAICLQPVQACVMEGH